MSESSFLSALEKLTAGDFSLGDLITVAGELAAAGDVARAQQLYTIWIRFNPEHPQLCVAHFNLSSLYTQTSDLKAAALALDASIKLNPDFMPAYINLGGVLEKLGSADQAIEQWQAVVQRRVPVTGPAVGFVTTALKQMGRVLSDHQRIEAAEAVLQQCVAVNPGQRDVLEQVMSLRLSQCKWPVLEPNETLDRATLMSGIHPLSMAAYTDDPLLQLAQAARYVERAVDDKVPAREHDRRAAPIDLTGRRLRVGYISSDLRDHAVGYLMAEVFELHHRSDVEVFAYYCGIPPSGPIYERTNAVVEHWVDIRSMSDDEAAARIEADGIDILVDVNGHTRDSRTGVFARRPAPIQVNWLGYPGTMGSAYHHYIIADDFIIPPEMELYYSEKVLRLPCYQPNDRKRVVADPPRRQDFGLPDDAVVFCCFNGSQKINRFTFDRWLEILRQVPDSVLWLLEASVETNNRLADYADQHGVSRTRILFAPKQPNAQHLARYKLADLFLDTGPYGAHTTASDAMWMGVPLLTLSGRGFASRVCGSLVCAAGMADLVCETPQAFVERAVALGRDRNALLAMRARLEANRATCDLFNMEKLVDRLEGLYREMVADYQAGRLPRPDLANLDAYLAVGMEDDHEAEERLTHPDYHGHYRARLARRHRIRPIPPDNRLWTEADARAAD